MELLLVDQDNNPTPEVGQGTERPARTAAEHIAEFQRFKAKPVPAILSPREHAARDNRLADEADARARGEPGPEWAAWRRRSKAYRASEKAKRTPPPLKPLARETAIRERDAFKAWLEIDGPRQRQIRPRAREIMAERFVLLQLRATLDREPGAAAFRKAPEADRHVRGSYTPDAARGRLRLLQGLEEPEGPWPFLTTEVLREVEELAASTPREPER